MKKVFLVAGFALALSASAQSRKKEPPPPPKPPNPPVELVDKVPSPPEPPLPPGPPPPPQQEQLPDDYEAFLKRNPAVKSLGWNSKNELIVHLKSGKEERFQLDNEQSRKEAVAKYGELPQAPPPPPEPPVPPKAPRAPKPKQLVSISREWQ